MSSSLLSSLPSLSSLSLPQLQSILLSVFRSYKHRTSKRIQLIDTFILFSLLTALTLMCYILIMGQFPFNSFLSALIACVGFLTFTVCLRIQVVNGPLFDITPERAYADYCCCNLLLFFVVVTFLG